ncbi:hypothetical protein AB0088_09860 [Klebsiella pneumoniae]
MTPPTRLTSWRSQLAPSASPQGLSRAISRSSTRPPVIPIGPSDKVTDPSVECGIGWVDHIPIPAVSRTFSATLSDKLSAGIGMSP